MKVNALKSLLVSGCVFAFASTVLAQEQPPVVDVQKEVVEAVEMYQDGNVKDATIALEALYAKDRDNKDIINWLGYIYLQSGSADKAVPLLVRAVQLQPDELSVRHDLAVAYMKAGRSTEASQQFVILIQKAPQNAEYHATLGSLYLKDNKTAEALPVLEKAHELAPNNVPVMSNLATVLVRTGQEMKALPIYEKLLAEDPEDEVALSWLGYLYLQSDEPAKAAETLEKARDLRPNDLEILNNLGNAYVDLGNKDKALEVYQSIVKLNPNLYQAWYNIGSIQLQRKDYSEAVTALRVCIEKNPTDPFVFNNLGRAYEELGRPTSAAENYKKAADLSPGNRTFSRNAGLALVKDRKEAEAAGYLERAIRQGVNEPGLKLVLAEVYTRLNRSDEALKMLEELTGELPGSGPFWFNLGVLRERSGDKAGAEEAYREALSINPADLDAMNNLGLLMFKSGQYQEALPHFEKLANTATESADAKLNLAAVYSKLNRMDEAVELWKSFLHVHPTRHDVRIDLANVLWKKGQLETARFHYQFINNRAPKNAPALNGLGLYSLYKSETVVAEAEALFRQAMAADKNYLAAHNNLAVALERQNKIEEAITVLENALLIDPNFADAKKNLDRLKALGG